MIQHIPGTGLRLDAVRRIQRALAPGGRFVTVNYRWGGVIPGREGRDARGGRHRTSFTPDEITALLQRCGLPGDSRRRVREPTVSAGAAGARAPWLLMPEVAFSHIALSARVRKYLIATALA